MGSQLSTYGRRLLPFRAPAPSTPVPLDFLYGAVAAHDFPLRSWRRAVQAERARSQVRLNYIELEGEPALRLPREAQLAGTAAGLHAVLWLTARQATDEPAIVRAARAAGVGVYPVSALYASPDTTGGAARPAGLILGYASLTPAQVAQGIRVLGSVLQSMASG